MTGKSLARGLVLVVDDTAASRYVNARTLRSAGFETLEAGTGAEALELARRELPELVLLDIKLPDFDGFEVCRRLREDPATASMAIVQISATFESAEYQVRGLEGGADTFLLSPVEPTVLVANVRAMLRLRRAEGELREFDKRKDEFLATVAHELRNPLAPLRYCLHMLEGSREPPLLEHCLPIMRRQTEHLVRLVDDLTDMSRITQNKLRLRLERVDLAQTIGAAIEAQRPEIEANGLALEVALPSERLEVRADPVRLAQVFGNLLANAVKYTPSGGHVRVGARLESPDQVAVIVQDDGRGIEAESLERIFDLFVQVGDGGKGLGIGLALVARLVSMHGGSVEAHSDGVGRGSTFTVRLPLAARASASAHVSNIRHSGM